MASDVMKKSWRNVEIEQQVRYGFTKEKVKTILDSWDSVKQYAFILQDKCKNKDGTDKEPHIHCMIAFKSPVPTTAILNKFNNMTSDKYDDKHQTPKENDNTTPCIWLGQLEKIKSWDSAVAYLTHENKTDKTRYDRAEIVANYDFNEDIERALNPIKDERLNSIISAIDKEEMRKYNYMDYVSAQEYVKYKKQIEDTFKYVNDRNISKGTVKNMQVIFITGTSGSGKTTYAKKFCNEHKFSYYISSGSNDVLDGYGGQDVLILDDLRPSCMGLSDLLKLLDNNTSSTVKSRYMNKSIAYCKYIIITTVLDIDNFFSNVFKEEQEPIIQFKRRCKTYMKFDKAYIHTYTFFDTKNDYIYCGKIPNPITLEYEKKDPTQEEILSIMGDLFKGLGDMSKAVIDNEPTFSQQYLDITDNDDIPFK